MQAAYAASPVVGEGPVWAVSCGGCKVRHNIKRSDPFLNRDLVPFFYSAIDMGILRISAIFDRQTRNQSFIALSEMKCPTQL